jgi:hypothetical protein
MDTLLQTTVDTFVTQCTETITQHTAQLQGLNRMVTHELRQPLGTFQFALKLLGAEETRTDRTNHDRILTSAERNVTRMNETLRKPSRCRAKKARIPRWCSVWSCRR